MRRLLTGWQEHVLRGCMSAPGKVLSFVILAPVQHLVAGAVGEEEADAAVEPRREATEPSSELLLGRGTQRTRHDAVLAIDDLRAVALPEGAHLVQVRRPHVAAAKEDHRRVRLRRLAHHVHVRRFSVPCVALRHPCECHDLVSLRSWHLSVLSTYDR